MKWSLVLLVSFDGLLTLVVLLVSLRMMVNKYKASNRNSGVESGEMEFVLMESVLF